MKKSFGAALLIAVLLPAACCPALYGGQGQDENGTNSPEGGKLFGLITLPPLPDFRGLTVRAGMGSATFSTNFWLFENSTMGLFTKASNLLCFQFGLDYKNSYIDLVFSPYLNAEKDCLFIEVNSGVWALDTFNGDSTSAFGLRAGIYFFGDIISFTAPLVSSSNQYQLARGSDVMALNGGLGVVKAGSGLRADLVLRFSGLFPDLKLINGIVISAGAYFSTAVILPFSPVLGLGVLGPDLEAAIVPGLLTAYLHTRLLNFFYETSSFEAGLKLSI